jgi:hypothetical protein
MTHDVSRTQVRSLLSLLRFPFAALLRSLITVFITFVFGFLLTFLG